MTNFESYANYYDLLYSDKQYDEEAAYVVSCLNSVDKDLPREILELGSGTGGHAEWFARHGWTVEAVDLSETMVNLARDRTSRLSPTVARRINMGVADARRYRANRKFGVVAALFHVVSYQATNDDLQRLFETARTHLNSGGYFAFDFWYGPAVLTQKPSVRIRRIARANREIIRIAEPELLANHNLVDVHYEIIDAIGGRDRRCRERHRMRYLFLPEIDLFLKTASFRRVHTTEWLTDTDLGTQSWSGFILAQAI